MEVKFSANGLVQAVVQDVRTNKVLRVGFLNGATWRKIEDEKIVYLFDEKSNQPMLVTGGEYNKPLQLSSFIVGEGGEAVVILANPDGSTTGADQFLGNKSMEDLAFLSYLQDFIEKRKREMPEGSYTTKLFTKGVNKISQKVGEEAVETIIEATNGTVDQFIYESSDLIYHLIVLLTEKGVRIEDLARELKARHKE
ncbi:MAG: phosphoribosyl-ATP diphosphatase [Paludibacteraceae bacterium]|nr:phosphoribosyl-ATP diphosphatase [Paludibacteraceae bacterium]